MTAAGRTRDQEELEPQCRAVEGPTPTLPAPGPIPGASPSPSGPESRVGAQKSPRAREASTRMRTGLLALDYFSKACLSLRKKSA